MSKTIFLNNFMMLLLMACMSCTGGKSTDDIQEKKVKVPSNSSFLNDKNYLYHNITNTESLKFIGKRTSNGNFDGKLYADSTFKKIYIELSKDEKSKLIATFISKELKVNNSYPVDLMKSFFVAKQDKIENLQPIIVSIGGDDYDSLTMILLDSKNNYVNGFNIEGGFQPGPEEQGDSLISFESKKYAHLNKNSITTIRIRETDYTDTTKKDIMIDSNVFVSVIDKSGKINTKQTVNLRFRKSKQKHH